MKNQRNQTEPSTMDPSLAALLAELKGPNQEHQIQAAKSIARLGPDAKAVLWDVCDHFRETKDDKVAEVLLEAIMELDGEHHLSPAFMRYVRGHHLFCQDVVEQFGGTPERGQQGIGLLLSEIHDPEEGYYSEAEAIAEIVRRNPALLVGLVEEFRHQPARRAWVGYALGNLIPHSDKALLALKFLMGDEDQSIRSAAVSAITEHESAATAVVPDIVRVFVQDHNGDCAKELKYAMGNLSHAVPELFDALLDLFKGADRDLADDIAEVLGDPIDGVAPFALERLQIALRDECHRVRAGAVETLCRIRALSEVAIRNVLRLLSDPVAEVRHRAAICIGYRDHATHVAVLPAMLDASADPCDLVRAQAACILGRFAEDPAAIHRLQEMCQDPSREVRSAVRYALMTVEDHHRQ